MDTSFILSIFFTLFIAVDPFGLIPVFIIYIPKHSPAERRKVILKSALTAYIVSIFFIFLGRYILSYLKITPGAFLISGGILLFLISIDLILARPRRTRSQYDDKAAASEKEDVSVFPLAIPLISGPGVIAALMMFSSQAEQYPYMHFIIAAIALIVILITVAVMFLSAHIERVLGKTGISVIQRIMGIVLSALAVQFLINGLGQVGIIR